MNNAFLRIARALACGLLVLPFALAGCERFSAKQGTDSHAGASAADHAGHDHGEAEHDDHAGHDHGEAEHADHAGHDHGAEEGDEHAGHDHGEAGHDDHAGHDHGAEEGGDHAGHDHAALISLTPEQMREFGVRTAKAAGGQLDIALTIPGEVAVNADAVGHVLPRLGGVVKSVSKNIGDSVRKGELLAVVESRELANAKADYLGAKSRESIALATQERERLLFEQGVSPEQDYIDASNALREVQIQVRAAAQALHALGVSEAQLGKLAASSTDSLTRYEIYAPLSGRVLEKHVSVGEMVSTESELFLIADLSSVWVNLNVSQQDLPRVKEGQAVRIRFSPSSLPDPAAAQPAGSGIPDAQGKVKYIDALLAADTRTAQARVVLSNPDGAWRPGMFVTGQIAVGGAPVAVLVPLAAVISFEQQDTVFVQDAHGFEPRAVELGRRSATHVEVLSGLAPGETYVVAGAFTVKAELGKSEAGHGH